MAYEIRIISTLNQEEVYAAKSILSQSKIKSKLTNSRIENFIYLSSSGFQEFYLCVSLKDETKAKQILKANGFSIIEKVFVQTKSKEPDHIIIALKASILSLFTIPVLVNIFSFFHLIKVPDKKERWKHILYIGLINLVIMGFHLFLFYRFKNP
tara:strand:- start:264 stop:725 length:462 start_codon:yes stop_codon:yes gene_type:complete